jgi:hypothetical protein
LLPFYQINSGSFVLTINNKEKNYFMESENNPQRRVSEIVEQELDKEILLYDLRNHKAFCLNETSALIWDLCDGQKSVPEISQQLSSTLKTPVTEDFVWLAIEQLSRENLIVNRYELKSDFNGLSRREMVKKAGLSTVVALPLVSSVISPTPAQAQSGPTCLAPSTLFECCNGGLDLCTPYCEQAARFNLVGMCCSESASAVFDCCTPGCNTVCQCS